MEPETAHIQIVDLPDEFLAELQRHLHPYSVAIARVRNDDANTFTPLGSGVLVKRSDRYGILTAHHCLHACTPEVTLGEEGGDTLLLILRDGRQVVIEAMEAIEIPLAFPEEGNYGEYGPDLTFIQVVSPDRCGSVAAFGSFWNLDRDPTVVLNCYSSVATPLASVGYPGVDYHTMIQQNNIHHVVKNMTYVNAIGEEDVTERDSWDYIDLTCTYTDANNLL